MFRIAADMLFGFGVLSLQADENLITHGKTLFQTKICFTCHQVTRPCQLRRVWH